MQTIRHEIDVMYGLVLGSVRLVADFDAAQPPTQDTPWTPGTTRRSG